MQQSLIGQPGEVSQNSLITFPVINEQSNQPFSQNVENQSLLETDHTRQLWKLPYYALLAKRGLFSHILARMFDCTYRQSPRHAMYHTNIPFFFKVHQIRENMESRHWHRPTNNAGCLLLMSPCMVAILQRHKTSKQHMNILCC